MKRLALDLDDLRQRYLDGVSEKELAGLYGCSRTAVRLRLIELGVEPRGRSEANRIRMRREGTAGRLQLTEAAHAAIRERGHREESIEARATARARTLSKASPYEDVLRRWLEERGRWPIPQQAVGRYNLDLGLHPVAVEVHRTANNPARMPATRKRAHYLLDHGWSVIYVWWRPGSRFELAEVAADEVVAFLELAERLPAGACQYRVIRGSGETVVSVGFDPDEVPFVPMPIAHERARRDD